jgi:phosphatidylethanolamine/phosphatidyl-N-methylethanolamine N-methyltransferase
VTGLSRNTGGGHRGTVFTFVRRFAQNPGQVGAIAPSGTTLARRMVKTLDLRPGQVCVELGPGMGAFTGKLAALARACGARLVLVERDPVFVRHLRAAHPDVTVIEGDARALPQLLATAGFAGADRILSGLPFRSFPPPLRADLAAAIGAALRPGGVLVQFTYFTREPLDAPCAREAGLAGRRTHFVLANVPPAFVWRYEKRAG